MNTPRILVALGMAVTVLHTGFAEDAIVPNAEFRRGDETPEGWHLSGRGSWIDRDVLQVSGNGSDSSFWWTGGVHM
ncbi:MAG: hypothetical protein JJ992_15630, partial [Planctomycetes bacterium]|nr:hypothetical protein [Planctomycetota bacterium]